MSKRFIINESDRRSIMKMYGLINEEEKATPCNTWKDGTFVNGDGKKTPKITITKTPELVTGIYEGPESGFCIQHLEGKKGDSIHQLSTITVFYECNPYLKELYKSGTYVRPDLEKIKLGRKPNFFKIEIPLIKTTEDQAITSINRRGSMGGDVDGKNRAEVDAAKKRPMHSEKTVKEGDMTEIFFIWRNLNDPSLGDMFPIKTKPSAVGDKSSKPSKGEEPLPAAENPSNKKQTASNSDKQQPSASKEEPMKVAAQNVQPSGNKPSFKVNEVYTATRTSNGSTYKIKIFSTSKIKDNLVATVITGPGVRDYYEMKIKPDGKLNDADLGDFENLKLLQ